MNRRQFGEEMFILLLANVLISISCGGSSPTTAPSSLPPKDQPPKPDTATLLTRLVAMPDYKSAQRVAFGSNGAARIAIRADIDWNFLIGDNTLAIGPPDSKPTSDVSVIEIPNGAEIRVRGF